jgi:hypothetical protein
MFRASLGLGALLMLGTSLPCSGRSADDTRQLAVTLSAADRGTVGKLACSPYQVEAESVGPASRWSGTGAGARVVHVPVRCAPHASDHGLPVRYQVRCQGGSGHWQCHEGREVLTVGTRLGEVSVEPGSFTHEQAIRAVRAAADSNAFRAQISAALPSGCGLYVDVSMHASELVDLSCNSGHSFLISFWCPQGDCPRVLSVR